VFEAMTDDGFTTSFDNAGADEKVLFAELGIIHANRVGSEVIGLVSDFLGQLGVGGLNLAE
jgi:hypothetical protein